VLKISLTVNNEEMNKTIKVVNLAEYLYEMATEQVEISLKEFIENWDALIEMCNDS
jgi:hypothetical protein